MKLGAIRLSEVGHFTTGVALEGLSGGLDILAGPNEMGKSTLFRAIEVAFRQPHTANNADVKALAPHSGGAPLIELDFEAGDTRWRLRKRYLAARSAELVDLGGGTRLRGADAETRLERLLAGRLDRARMLGLLWVGQQESLALPKDAKGDIGQSLGALIEDEIADAGGGGMARRVRDAVREALDGLVSRAHKRPAAGKPYKAAIDARDEAAARFEAAQTAATAARERLDALSAARADLERRSTPAAVAARHGQLARLEEARAVADRAEAEVRRADLEVEARQAALDRVREGLQRRVANAKERERLSTLVATSEGELSDAEAALRSATTTRSDVRTRLDLARRHVEGAQRDLAAHDLWARQQSLEAALAELRARVEQAKDIEARGVALAAAAPGPAIAPAKLDEMRRFAGEIDRLEARIAATRAKVRIDYVGGGEGRISVGGRKIEASGEIGGGDLLTIEIDGIGRITVASPTAAAGRDRETLEAARAGLAGLLADAGVADVEDAARRVAAHEQHEAAVRALRQEFVAVAPKGIGELRQRVAECESALTATGSPACPPTATRAEVAVRLTAATSEVAALEQRDRAVGEEILVASTARARITAARAAAEQRLLQLAGTIEDETEAAMAGLRQQAAESEAALQAAVRDRSAWGAAALSPAARATLLNDIAAAQRAVDEAEAAQQRLALEIRGLESALERDRHDGVDALVADARAALETAEARVRTFETQVQELQLLDRLLDEEARASRENELRPVVERLRVYARDVLPGASFELADKLVVSGLMREGGMSSAGRLSGGTSEQIAVLVRLAYARLLADRGEGLPLVLDDALVYADGTRFKAMMAALDAAATHHQVIMLTCHPERLDHIGPMSKMRRLELTPWSPN